MMIKQLIKNSLLGALMLPAIMMSGCTEPNKPNKPQEEKDPVKDGIGVVIENVTIDGVPVSPDQLRAVGRKDIVRFHKGVTNPESLIELFCKPETLPDQHFLF